MSNITEILTSTQFSSYVAGVTEDKTMLSGFTTSFLAILVSQIGDKTFFLAMIMALRYSHTIVFLGSYGALFAMTILSTIFGKLVTSWLSPVVTNILVTILFLYFGIKMLIDAKQHQQSGENQQLKEVQEQLKEMQKKFIQKQGDSKKPLNGNQQKKKAVLPNKHVLSQAFVMTFLAEWGDRSQIATFALAASFNAFMVTLGALLGHAICTFGAVKIGTFISGKVTQKQVLTVGGLFFILSGIYTAYLVYVQNA